MTVSLLHSLLELAHATSQNLAFAHRDDVHVSYGEETITETNLLELRRRHPKVIKLNTFGKGKEGLNGADWEWHIIGRARTFRMRVQAKRLQRDNRLIIPHKVASSGAQQIDLLINDAAAHRLKPVYCFYTSEAQRSHWRVKPAPGLWEGFESGCLLASAHKVKAIMPKTLGAIEKDCIPWHYLVERRRYKELKVSDLLQEDGLIGFLSAVDTLASFSSVDEAHRSSEDFPTIDALNADNRPAREIEGLVENGSIEGELRLPDSAYLERGITKLIEIDVRNMPRRAERDRI